MWRIGRRTPGRLDAKLKCLLESNDVLGRYREINVWPINTRKSVVLVRLECFRNGARGLPREAALIWLENACSIDVEEELPLM